MTIAYTRNTTNLIGKPTYLTGWNIVISQKLRKGNYYIIIYADDTAIIVQIPM